MKVGKVILSVLSGCLCGIILYSGLNFGPKITQHISYKIQAYSLNNNSNNVDNYVEEEQVEEKNSGIAKKGYVEDEKFKTNLDNESKELRDVYGESSGSNNNNDDDDINLPDVGDEELLLNAEQAELAKQEAADQIFTCPLSIPNDEKDNILKTKQYDPNILLPFYLYDEIEAFDNRPLLACIERISKLRKTTEEGKLLLSDLIFNQKIAEGSSNYLGDAIIIEGLRNHPLRVDDPTKATLFIIGFSPILSYAIPQNPSDYGCEIPQPTHEHRMEAFHTALKELKKSITRKPKNHVLLCSDCTNDILGQAIFNTDIEKLIIVSTKEKAGLITSDFKFTKSGSAKKKPAQKVPPTITIPYLNTKMLLGGMSVPMQRRTINFFIDANVNVEWHMSFIENFKSSLPRSYSNLDKQHSFLRKEYERNHMYSLSKYCLILSTAGNNFPRLFDALYSGCIPILIASYQNVFSKLPFSNLIDWRQGIIFIDGLGCANQQRDLLIKLFKEELLNKENIDQLQVTMQEKISKLIKKLDYPKSIVDYRIKDNFINFNKLPDNSTVLVSNNSVIRNNKDSTNKEIPNLVTNSLLYELSLWFRNKKDKLIE